MLICLLLSSGYLVLSFYNLLSSIIRALGDSKTPFYFLVLATVLNIILDLFCILVLGWGVMGAAIATVFSQGVSAFLCYVYMYRKFDILRARRKNGSISRSSGEDVAFHWRSYGIAVLHYGHWQYHASECE